MRKIFISVVLDQNFKGTLDYAVPIEMVSRIQVGMRVEVPIKSTLKKATIVEIKDTCSFPKVRPITRILSDIAELSEMQWKLAHWMARYYVAPMQRVLKCFIPPNIRHNTKPKTQIYLSLNQSLDETIEACKIYRRENPKIADVLDLLLQKRGCFAADLHDEKTVRALIKKKLVVSKKIPVDPDLLLEEEFFQTSPKILNEEQKKCLQEIEYSMQQNHFAAHLIHGVTGSGKTEIYLQAIASALQMGKSAILLVPEISLTSQTIERFRSRFKEKIAILHHKRSLGERSFAWEKLRTGEIRIAIGARSAIFAPMQNLGLVIVDEEHDSSYKQSEEAPFYHARNVAVMRAHLEKAAVILGSATPSIESRYNVDLGKYKLHTVATRATKASLPKVKIIDMKKAHLIHGGFTHFSDELLDGIKRRLEMGEQTLLFLNRRGYHRIQMCVNCREMIKCPHCDLSLTYHRGAHLLRCHLCDFKRESPKSCPSCGSSESLEFKGFGTEHVQRSLHAVYPEIRTLRMDRDTTQKKDGHEEIFKQFRAHKADVLIGTQMVAKGFHFPSVTLVGILNGDAPLNIPDFRAAESVFQILTQVAGRSGRSDLPGEVILQTYLPNHPVLKLAAEQNYNAFYNQEIQERRLFGYPPFTHLIKCQFLSTESQKALDEANKAHVYLLNHLPPFAKVLPPGPSGHAKIKDQYRFQFLIKTTKIDPIIPILESLPISKVQTKIDIDPLSTYF